MPLMKILLSFYFGMTGELSHASLFIPAALLEKKKTVISRRFYIELYKKVCPYQNDFNEFERFIYFRNKKWHR